MVRIATLVSALLVMLSCPLLHAETIHFDSNGNRLSGVYLPPYPGLPACGVIITVHGDGPLDREAHGYYPLIWKPLRERGYAVLSWDKPGVGDSSGNWLQQSMADRQQEVLAAIAYVEHRFGPQQTLGLLGFSQAGWVVPAVANQHPGVDFLIGIGFAINWAEQGWYLTQTRLQRQGASPQTLQRARKQYQRHLAFLTRRPSYADYLASVPDQESPMSPDRFVFALKNLHADASAEYPTITQPLLILLGEDDLNVDIRRTESFLESLRQSHPHFQINVLPGATHSLLDSRHFNTQNPGFVFLMKLHLFGDDAVSPRLNPVLDQWLAEQPCDDDT